MPQDGVDFNAIRISLASPEQVKIWSYGEVTKPETINYRTLRPEKDGLFCERIFGPTKDWECYCGKYKKIRYRGVICDRCGVEVARSKVRRERMGHISLAVPVAHIWFSKGIPSRMGLLPDLSPRNLERILYFAQYIVTEVDEDARQRALDNLNEFRTQETAEKKEATDEQISQIQSQLETEISSGLDSEAQQEKQQAAEKEIQQLQKKLDQELETLNDSVESQIEELEDLRVLQLLPEGRYRELRDQYREVFKAGMGAETILEILRAIDLDELRLTLQKEVHETSGQRRKKAIKRLRIVEAFHKSGNKPEWMTISALPILPPELRPMVQLDGGRFATSDLNDLYRRVINRNNRLKRLMELQAPEVIVRNEKRMLQEAVDALIDNGRRGRAISGSHNHKLKSLTDLLRGKHGRFRQNLLGKRVDYSGRSVITVGPELKLDQCGLPKRMALELFKPFVMNRLVMQGFAHNIKSAKRMVERVRPEVWDILEDVIKDRPVLLNRAPTLHRLGIQAFQPILVEGSSIQIHPLVCTAFNADFDGDQMAVHVPLSREAVLEAKRIMLSTNNLLSPSSGEPIVTPTLDMVLGCYYMTTIQPGATEEGKRFNSFSDCHLAYDMGVIGLRAKILVKDPPANGNWLETSAGRIIFNEVLPPELGFLNEVMDKTALKNLIAKACRSLGNEVTHKILDSIKELGFHYATQAGITIAINDIETPEGKKALIRKAEGNVKRLEEQYQRGLITDEERYNTAIRIWTDASDQMTNLIEETLPSYGGIYLMAISGAKGNIAQIKQMAGMRGLMSDPKGRIIDLPIKSSFREGLSVLEYFISTHGARKGLADTALRTADSGYLTRRLIDVSQDVIVLLEDCQTTMGIWIEEQPEKTLAAPFAEHLLSRRAAGPVIHPKTDAVILEHNQELDEEAVERIIEADVTRVFVRSALTCQADRGICANCYGRSLATGRTAMMGEAVGIIGAQSIGEPGTQLTMRTFHTGGVAGVDITSGLPRVEELFEARVPKGHAELADIDGVVEVSDTSEGRIVKVTSTEEYSDEYSVPRGYSTEVADGDQVEVGTPMAVSKKKTASAKKKDSSSELAQPTEVVARIAGRVKRVRRSLSIIWTEEEQREYQVSAAAHIIVQTGDRVTAGQPLTAGPKNPQDILRIQGGEEVQNYLIEEVQKVYRSQGVSIHDKHIEVILRQMLRKVRVETTGDTELLPGELIDRFAYEETNAKVLAEGGEPATASPMLLGITKASLNTESFLAAASFQETARVLTNASIMGAVDQLQGLKENVIIGHLIPARFDLSEEGRQRLGLDELEHAGVGVLSGSTEAPPTWDIEEVLEEVPGL